MRSTVKFEPDEFVSLAAVSLGESWWDSRTGDSTQGTLTASMSSVREYGVPLFASYIRLSTRLTVAWNWGVRAKTDIAPWPHIRFHNSVNHI